MGPLRQLERTVGITLASPTVHKIVVIICSLRTSAEQSKLLDITNLTKHILYADRSTSFHPLMAILSASGASIFRLSCAAHFSRPPHNPFCVFDVRFASLAFCRMLDEESSWKKKEVYRKRSGSYSRRPAWWLLLRGCGQPPRLWCRSSYLFS